MDDVLACIRRGALAPTRRRSSQKLFPNCSPRTTRSSARWCQSLAYLRGKRLKVSDGARTHDRLDHNQELYQLSYAHHETA
jgi:hypothetical protein